MVSDCCFSLHFPTSDIKHIFTCLFAICKFSLGLWSTELLDSQAMLSAVLENSKMLSLRIFLLPQPLSSHSRSLSTHILDHLAISYMSLMFHSVISSFFCLISVSLFSVYLFLSLLLSFAILTRELLILTLANELLIAFVS